MKLLVLILSSLLLLTACADKEKRVFFDGNFYPAKGKRVKGDREMFTVSVRRVSQGLAGAREAGRHAGVTYCIKNFGSSDINWIKGPDAEEATLSRSGGNLTLEGQCGVW